MDLSALIFVALAVAWAVYLVPKALKHHDEVARTRSVDRFSRSLRVLARREPVDGRSARLVTPRRSATATAAEPAPAAAPTPLSPAQLRARRAAAQRATKRRRNVLALILLVNVAVVAVAAFSVISWWYVAAPAGLLVAWLVACRLMVKGERRALAPAARIPGEKQEEPESTPADDESTPASAPAASGPAASAADDEVDPMADTSTGIAAIVDPELWDPVSVPLPTYVGQPVAARSVRTIDLDSTGVWTSGRTDADAALAREADAADQAARRKDHGDGRAFGT